MISPTNTTDTLYSNISDVWNQYDRQPSLGNYARYHHPQPCPPPNVSFLVPVSIHKLPTCIQVLSVGVGVNNTKSLSSVIDSYKVKVSFAVAVCFTRSTVLPIYTGSSVLLPTERSLLDSAHLGIAEQMVSETIYNGEMCDKSWGNLPILILVVMTTNFPGLLLVPLMLLSPPKDTKLQIGVDMYSRNVHLL